MSQALRDIAEAADRGTKVRDAAAVAPLGGILRRLVAHGEGGQVRSAAAILVQWRAVEPRPDDGSDSPSRQVASSVLRAEYASSFIQRCDSAAELGRVPWGSDAIGNAAQDPRAREATDNLVAALWDAAAAIARVACYDAGTPEHDDAVEDLRELRYVIADLERALRERPWTEEA